MKRTLKKIFKTGKSKIMITGGLGRNGLYFYAGVKHKSGFSAGASAGSQGRNIYGSYNKKRNQIRVKHNVERKKTSVRLRKPLGFLKK